MSNRTTTTLGSGIRDSQFSPLRMIAASHAASLEATFGLGSAKVGTLAKLDGVSTVADTMAKLRADLLASSRSALSPGLAFPATAAAAAGIRDSQFSPLRMIAASHAASLEATFGLGSAKVGTLAKLDGVSTVADTMAKLRADLLASSRSALSPGLAFPATAAAAAGIRDSQMSPLRMITASHAASLEATFGLGSAKVGTLAKLHGVSTVADTMAKLRADLLASSRSALSPGLAFPATAAAAGIRDSQMSPLRMITASHAADDLLRLSAAPVVAPESIEWQQTKGGIWTRRDPEELLADACFVLVCLIWIAVYLNQANRVDQRLDLSNPFTIIPEIWMGYQVAQWTRSRVESAARRCTLNEDE